MGVLIVAMLVGVRKPWLFGVATGVVLGSTAASPPAGDYPPETAALVSPSLPNF